MPLKSNHIVADWISRGYFRQLLDAGVRIFRFKDAMVHAKTSTIDGTWSTVGTANVDRLSLQGNYEINVEVIDEAFAENLEEIYRTDESQLPRAHPGRVGGAGPAPQVHRDDPRRRCGRCSERSARRTCAASPREVANRSRAGTPRASPVRPPTVVNLRPADPRYGSARVGPERRPTRQVRRHPAGRWVRGRQVRARRHPGAVPPTARPSSTA